MIEDKITGISFVDPSEVEMVPIDRIRVYEKNAKRHTPEQIEQIKNSIEAFGMDDPIAVWSEENIIVEGHGRYLALRAMGFSGDVPVIRLDHLTDEQRKAYALAHNKLTMNTDFNLEQLEAELDELSAFFDMADFGFDLGEEDRKADWFESGDKGEAREGEDEYKEFLDKFEAKHTTDDCYTPKRVYEVVADWVAREYGKNRNNFVRPFYPGGDYQKEQYKPSDIVVDNPPFSILSEIVNYYNEKGILFFMFSHGLTVFGNVSDKTTAVCVDANILYENGATIATNFITNMDSCRARTAPELSAAIRAAVDEIRAEQRKELPKYSYPDNVVTASMLNRYSKYGIDFRVSREESTKISELDEQKEQGKAIFGGGLLISDSAAAKKAAAEKAAAEKWHLSKREKEIIETLNRSGE